MRLYLIRHADPDYPNNTITPAGHLEAQALGERMKKLGLDHIYASPLGRAVHTMEYSARALGMTHTIEPWTAELNDCHLDFPPIGKIAVWDVPGEVIRAQRPYATQDTWHEHELFRQPIFKETADRVACMSDAFFARHGYVREGGRYRIVKANREKIAVFCHGGFGLFWLAHLLEIPLPLMWSGFHLPPSSVTTILFDERSKDWAVPRCTGLGDVSHLYAAGLPTQPAGIKANVD
ncbi:MAG: histidine phosphatase family protein [Tepidisphaeraceae bacterium]